MKLLMNFSITSFKIPNWVRGSDFIFDSVQLFYYKCHKINFKRGGSYVDPLNWIKKAAINPKHDGYKYLQYATIFALILKKLKKDRQKIWNISHL